MYLAKASLVDAIQNTCNNCAVMDDFNDFFHRFAQVEPHINAFIPEMNFKERILKDIRNLQEKYPDEADRPPLFGVPVAVKDLIQVDGFPTRAGSKLPSEALTGPEGTLISKLRSVGAVMAGKTVTEEFAFHSLIPTRNPHNINRSPGGSSAGSAASVAAGLCPFAVGTQTLRSVIAPASFCGVVGFKPSYARVALDGVILLSPSFDTIGFFAQDMESMRLASSRLISDWRTIEAERKPVLGVPNGVYMNLMFDDVKRLFEAQLHQLEQKGYAVQFVDMPWDDDFIMGDAMIRMVQGEMAQVHERWFYQYEHLYGSSVSEAIKNGRKVPIGELEEYRNAQLKLRNEIEQVKVRNHIDLWVSPAKGGVAPENVEKTGWSGMTAVWSYAGLPAISIPAAKINGMPLGFQCIGSYGNDETLLGWAEQIDSDLQIEGSESPGN